MLFLSSFIKIHDSRVDRHETSLQRTHVRCVRNKQKKIKKKREKKNTHEKERTICCKRLSWKYFPSACSHLPKAKIWYFLVFSLHSFKIQFLLCNYFATNVEIPLNNNRWNDKFHDKIDRIKILSDVSLPIANFFSKKNQLSRNQQ